ncbi:LamG domain-containing protein [Marinagarivorans algicola]|uniref:LamG domain-containing protein n=1 Tax=Marinagarivorans algicola TaxID=1513270 RepID=UPI000AB49DAD|nr:LamG domain-containing protein [Marinagarivorans algicola]
MNLSLRKRRLNIRRLALNVCALWWMYGAILLTTSGCSQDSAPTNDINPPAVVEDDGVGIVYKGPSPTTADVQRFMVNVWSNIALDSRCGACHIEGGQMPEFARRDDIDQAYVAASTVVDLETPSLSRMVAKVAGGHNCWLPEASVCADTLVTWISAWANAANAAAGEGAAKSVITLLPPEVKPVKDSKPFPEASTDFESTIYSPFLRRYCAECHAADSPTPQQPYFAGSQVDAAYTAAKSKINLNAPERSRMVARLQEESHNCWSASCANDAVALQKAIEQFASGIEAVKVNDKLVVSNALQLAADGIVANTGGRVEPDIIAKYEFKTGHGQVAYDTSGQEPALNLNLSGDVAWLEGGVWGLRFLGGRAQGATAVSKKLHRKITFTQEYSIEAWVAPANVTQEGPARIVSYSGGNNSRNFTLGQSMYNYDVMNRTLITDLNGEPRVSTPNADEILQATLQHVVITFSSLEGRRIYVNGELITQEPVVDDVDNSISNWDDTFALILGVETSGMYPWLGSMRFLGIHSRALTAESIMANYEAGVGEKFFLLFRVTDNLSAGAISEGAEAYVVFEVEPYDSYSYLFANPFFYILDPNKTATSTAPVPLKDIQIEGMRIGVNGRETLIGQAYANVKALINTQNYIAGEGQSLSSLGALIPVEQGKSLDEFFLTFDTLEAKTFIRPAEVTAPQVEPEDTPEGDQPATVGVKTFAEINASLAQMTGVSATNPAVKETYQKVRQQLPVDENMEGFLPAHHMGVTQLAVTYCNALINSPALRNPKFPDFDFNAQPSTAFSVRGRAAMITPLLNALVITSSAGELNSGPSVQATRTELNKLVDIMTRCGTSCPAGTTLNTATAVCAAALGSAAMLVQ